MNKKYITEGNTIPNEETAAELFALLSEENKEKVIHCIDLCKEEQCTP